MLQISFLVCFACISAITAFGAGRIDPAFIPLPTREPNQSTISGNLKLQPNGKTIIFGSFQFVDGVTRNGIARLNTDGSLDTSFNCPACEFPINSVIVQTDGEIIVAGATIRRLNPDGSVDASFTSPFDPAHNVNVWAVQPDGKVLATEQLLFNVYLYRLNLDGTIDSTFTRIYFSTQRGAVLSKIMLTPDGKIVANGRNILGASSFLSRFNADGASDNTFAPPSLISPGAVIGDFDVQSDNNIVFVGSFTAVNGVNRAGIAKLLPSGTIDPSFVPTNVLSSGEGFTQVKVLPNGQVIVTVNNIKFYRFNSNGSLDNTFSSPSNLFNLKNFILDGAGRIVLFGSFVENGNQVYKYARLNLDGSLDNSFNPRVAYGAPSSIMVLATQPNGKIIVAGSFSQVNGVPRVRIARLNSNGSTDASFDAGSGFDNNIYKIVVQPDGKILVGGAFNNFNGSQHVGIVRLNVDGSLDSGFNPILSLNNSLIYTILLQPNGKILIGGFFATINGTSQSGVAQLNGDGSLDASFDVMLENFSAVGSILVQSDGKIVIAGDFEVVNGISRREIARLNSDGSLDATFDVGVFDSVRKIEVQPDGKYLALTSQLVRLNNDGTADSSFQAPTWATGNVLSFILQSDGSILIGGNFVTYNGSNLNLARLRPDGSLDQSFIPNGANDAVRVIVKQADGRVLIGGDFTRVASDARLGLARLISTLTTACGVLFDFDGDGRADISVFRPANGIWYRLNSGSNNSFVAALFGASGDLIAPADFDADGKTDLAIFRPSTGIWYLQQSTSGTSVQTFGQTGDVPAPGDFDGDGKADLAVFRPSTGVWYLNRSGAGFSAVQFGQSGDVPQVGDFDGDGKADISVYRPSNGVWYRFNSSNNSFVAQQFGQTGDLPDAADFDGDGKTDLAVFRPSTGFWYLQQSTVGFSAQQFGLSGDLPAAADYDGDGKADIAIFRPSIGTWYLLQSTNSFTTAEFGQSGDKPIEAAYNY